MKYLTTIVFLVAILLMASPIAAKGHADPCDTCDSEGATRCDGKHQKGVREVEECKRSANKGNRLC